MEKSRMANGNATPPTVSKRRARHFRSSSSVSDSVSIAAAKTCVVR